MGGGEGADEQHLRWAYELGKAVATHDWILLTGGRKAGVMDAASRGAKDNGGFVVGVLMGEDASSASDAVDVVIATGMGSARNNINVLSSDVVIACGAPSPGTLSEIALALKAKKPVVLLNDDPQAIAFLQKTGEGLLCVADAPEIAINIAVELLAGDSA
jgi:uncharacterized protein (TIGR00725 family)